MHLKDEHFFGRLVSVKNDFFSHIFILFFDVVLPQAATPAWN
jgi:hypothetical protein